MAIDKLTAADIRARLAEIAQKQSRHHARDMTAELAAVIRDGGDADAVEDAQQRAERDARRLRAEKIALEGLLPEALAREGTERLKQIAASHAAEAIEARQAVADIAAAWDAFAAAASKWPSHQRRAEELTRQAGELARESGASMPPMGLFNSPELMDVFRRMNREAETLQYGFTSAERGLDVGFGYQVHPLSGAAEQSRAA